MSIWYPHKSNQCLITHNGDRCFGAHCPVHKPSDHHMADWPQYYREDRGVTERICPHGIGHPDPDDIRWEDDAVHGCDGCCTPPKPKVVTLLTKVKRKIRELLAYPHDVELTDQYIDMLGEQETAAIEIERLNSIIEILVAANNLRQEMDTDQKRIINMLKVAAGITKKRGRPRKVA